MYTNHNLQMFLFYYFLRSVNLSIAVILFTEDFVCLLFPYTADWKVLSFVLEITCYYRYIYISAGNNYAYIDNIRYVVIFHQNNI